MSLNKKERNTLISNFLDLCGSSNDLKGLNLQSIVHVDIESEESSRIFWELLEARKKSKLIHNEKARIAMFYSFVIGMNRDKLTDFDYVYAAKEIGLKLGLPSIGVSQVLHEVRRGTFDKSSVTSVVELFSTYSN